MKNYTLGKDVTGHWNSFTDLAKDYGCKPVVKKTPSKNKLEKMHNRFNKRHLCKACNYPMTYLPGSNIMTCTNPKCEGIKVEKTDSCGNVTVTYLTSYDLLDDVGTEIANKIF